MRGNAHVRFGRRPEETDPPNAGTAPRADLTKEGADPRRTLLNANTQNSRSGTWCSTKATACRSGHSRARTDR
jgi:hypothetical protein